MSSGGWDEFKKPIYQLTKAGSRDAQRFGNMIGGKVGDYIEEEGKKNEENPGRALTKGAAYTAAYLLTGGLLDAAAPAAEAAAAEGAVGAGAGAAASGAVDYGAAVTAQELAAQQAAQGLLSQSAAPVTDLSTNAVQVADRSTQAGLLDKARLAFSSGSGTGKGGLLAQQMGMKMLAPQEPQQQPMAPPPRQQGNMEPLPRTYSSQPAGLLSLEEMERRRRMRMMGGYQ